MNYLITNEDLSVTLSDGDIYTLHSSHINFKNIIASLIEGDEEKVIKYLDIKSSIKEWGNKRVHIENGQLFFKGELLNGALAKRALGLYSEGKSIKPIELFLEKLSQNPDKEVANQLYRFLTTNNLPLTWDGDFLAYKIVNKDYLDHHSGTIDNSIGKFVKLDRDKCCADPNQLCAPGLHACSKEYFGNYSMSNSKLIVIKISPKNVVSIPLEYQDTKLRCCAYYCLQDCPENIPVDFIYENSVVWEQNQKPVVQKKKVYKQQELCNDVKKGVQSMKQRRDSKGRFLSKQAPVRDSKGRFTKKS